MKEKLKMGDLAVKSFVTRFAEGKGHTIKGAGSGFCSDYLYCGGTYDDGDSDYCNTYPHSQNPKQAGCTHKDDTCY